MSAKPAYLRSLPPVNDAERLAMRDLARQRAEALHVLDQRVMRATDAVAACGDLEETLVLPQRCARCQGDRVHVKVVGSGDAFGSGGRYQTCIALAENAQAPATVLLDCGATTM
ncbi:MAG: hypothetical protein ACRDO0_04150, partial [Nocardioidaceae bacterium]